MADALEVRTCDILHRSRVPVTTCLRCLTVLCTLSSTVLLIPNRYSDAFPCSINVLYCISPARIGKLPFGRRASTSEYKRASFLLSVYIVDCPKPNFVSTTEVIRGNLIGTGKKIRYACIISAAAKKNYSVGVSECQDNGTWSDAWRPCREQGIFPAGTWRRNDVVLTSMRRDYIASASVRRHFDVMCPLG